MDALLSLAAQQIAKTRAGSIRIPDVILQVHVVRGGFDRLLDVRVAVVAGEEQLQPVGPHGRRMIGPPHERHELRKARIVGRCREGAQRQLPQFGGGLGRG